MLGLSQQLRQLVSGEQPPLTWLETPELDAADRSPMQRLDVVLHRGEHAAHLMIPPFHQRDLGSTCTVHLERGGTKRSGLAILKTTNTGSN